MWADFSDAAVKVNTWWICHSSLITVECMQSHGNKLSVTFLISNLPSSSWSLKHRGEKSTSSNFKLPQELLVMPEGFWHMLEKLTISEMARYPEGTAKRKKALHIKTHHRNELQLFSNGLGLWLLTCSQYNEGCELEIIAVKYILLHGPLTSAFCL